MSHRVANTASTARVGTDLARSFQNLAKIQSQVTSGKLIQRPSDDPAQVAAALDSRATVRRMEQYAANAADAAGWLRITDDTLMGVQEQAAQAKVRVINAINGGMDANARKALADDIRETRAGLIQMANRTYQGRAIFAGTALTTAPYSETGEYGGDGGEVHRRVDEGVTLTVNVTGEQVFGTRDETDPLAGDLFQVLEKMAEAIEAGDVTAMNAAHGALEQAVNRVGLAQIHVGVSSSQIEDTVSRNELVLLDVKQRLSEIEDVDLAEAIISLKSNEAAYQAALGVTARVIQPSLLDFLR